MAREAQGRGVLITEKGEVISSANGQSRYTSKTEVLTVGYKEPTPLAGRLSHPQLILAQNVPDPA